MTFVVIWCAVLGVGAQQENQTISLNVEASILVLALLLNISELPVILLKFKGSTYFKKLFLEF